MVVALINVCYNVTIKSALSGCDFNNASNEPLFAQARCLESSVLLRMGNTNLRIVFQSIVRSKYDSIERYCLNSIESGEGNWIPSLRLSSVFSIRTWLNFAIISRIAPILPRAVRLLLSVNNDFIAN